MLLGAVLTLIAVAAFGQRREAPSDSGNPPYRITSWPDHDPNKRYSEEVQEHLNNLAAEGWRFHSEIVGQSVKMLVFERSSK
jgi:hypothetical protein